MSRLPIRWKLTLAFALGLTVVLTAVGVFLHAQLSANVDAAIERDLRTRAYQLRELVIRSPVSGLPTHSEDLEPDESVAHILAPAGGVVAASSHGDVRLLTAEQLRAAATRELFLDRPGDAMLDESLRIFAMPVQARGETFIVVVTESLDERAKTLASALAVEIVGLAAALIASCGIGYWVAGLALRPVETLRRRAAAISGDDLAERRRRCRFRRSMMRSVA
jgi:two-component system, OmpR family, sensor kinase